MELKSKFNVGDYAYYLGTHNNTFAILYCRIDDINFGVLSSNNEDSHQIQYNITIYYIDNNDDNRQLHQNTRTHRIYNTNEDTIFKDEKDIIEYIKGQMKIISSYIKNQSEKSS